MRYVFVVALCFFQLSFAQADSKDCSRRFRVAINNYPPLYYLNDKKEITGLSHEMMNAIAARVGCIFNQDPMDAPRVTEEFSRWRADFVAFQGPSAPLQTAGEYIPLYQVARKIIVTAKVYEEKKQIEDYLKDPKIKFGNQIGTRFFMHKKEQEALSDANRLVETPDPVASYRLLVNGRIHAMFSSPAIHKYFVETMPELKEKIRAIPDPSLKLEIGLYVSKKRVSAEEFARVRAAVQSLQKDGTLKKIVSKYIGNDDLKWYESL